MVHDADCENVPSSTGPSRALLGEDYRACLVEDDLYALAALRYLDRNPVRAGLVEDPITYTWSSCAIYAGGGSSHLITYHPSYLTLSRYPKVRRRHYRAILAPSSDPKFDGRDSRWSSQRAVGSPLFLARHLPPGARRGNIPVFMEILKLRS